MLLRWRKILFIIFVVHVFLLLLARYLSHVNIPRTLSPPKEASSLVINNQIITKDPSNGPMEVDIWGKAAISEYFWLHVFEGDVEDVPGYMLQKGKFALDHLSFTYKTGPYLLPHTANKNVKNLVIVLNGREEVKVDNAREWMDALLDNDIFLHLRNLGVILLGNEGCENFWLKNYIDSEVLKFVFVVYDIELNSKLLQWPLGVATYRRFPKLRKGEIDILSKRKYVCNFMGTVYPDSSRTSLENILSENDFNCFLKTRHEWQPKETKDSMDLYHKILKDSDLTLCPVGINAESYRIYESLSYGSVPVLEDVMTEGNCDQDSGPYRLLKKYKAPVIYVKNWKELGGIMQKEGLMSMEDIVKRRERVLNWYEIFKYKLREEFIGAVTSRFDN